MVPCPLQAKSGRAVLQRGARLILKNAVVLSGLMFSTLVIHLPECCLLSGLRPLSLRDGGLFSKVDANISLNPLPMKLVLV